MHHQVSYSGPPILQQTAQISIYILTVVGLYTSILHGIPHGCSFRGGWMDTMNSLPWIILRSKCKCRKSGKALRKLLPTWLALMNSSQRLRQIPKLRIASMWLRWLITLLNVFVFFLFLNTSFNLKQWLEVCAEPVLLLVWKCAVNWSATQARGAHM